ncbi:hypothetical protein D3C72_1819050 [compost metagenome]
MPSRRTRNLVKFHLIPCVPSTPRFSVVSQRYSGCASSPLTSILANIGKLTLKRDSQNWPICCASPGSCLPNWLHGKPSTTRPRSRYSSYSFCRPAYCGVKPHSLAVLTTSSTLPWNCDSGTGCPDSELASNW